MISRSARGAAVRLAVAAALIVPSFAVIAGIGAAGHVSGRPRGAGDLDGSVVRADNRPRLCIRSASDRACWFARPQSERRLRPQGQEQRRCRPGRSRLLELQLSRASAMRLTVPAATLCGVRVQLGRTPVLCAANSAGPDPLTYMAPAQPPAQAVVLFTAGNTASNPIDLRSRSLSLRDRRTASPSSPIATPGSLAANANVAVTLSADDAADQGIPNDTVDLSFTQASGGGSARDHRRRDADIDADPVPDQRVRTDLAHIHGACLAAIRSGQTRSSCRTSS